MVPTGGPITGVSASGYRINTAGVEELAGFSEFAGGLSSAALPFVSPGWLAAWWKHFGSGLCPLILHATFRDATIGLIPLMASGDTTYLMGGSNVCDYLDILAAPEHSRAVCAAMLEYLKKHGFREMDLYPLRPESIVLTHLAGAAETIGCRTEITPHDVSFEMDLPDSWTGYLNRLTGKERHEIRRKLRRLEKLGDFELKSAESAEHFTRLFFDLFASSRPEKAGFMNSAMKAFFGEITADCEKSGILRPLFLEVSGKPAAAVICFDYRGRVSLYNNAYDPDFSAFSVGALSKVLSILQSIRAGRHTFDFLKGAERYKKRLGGKPVTLFRCRISIR
jgi:CelD/BcsL family acetyltransferase involved in cellulose biosynthesis